MAYDSVQVKKTGGYVSGAFGKVKAMEKDGIAWLWTLSQQTMVKVNREEKGETRES